MSKEIIRALIAGLILLAIGYVFWNIHYEDEYPQISYSVSCPKTIDAYSPPMYTTADVNQSFTVTYKNVGKIDVIGISLFTCINAQIMRTNEVGSSLPINVDTPADDKDYVIKILVGINSTVSNFSCKVSYEVNDTFLKSKTTEVSPLIDTCEYKREGAYLTLISSS